MTIPFRKPSTCLGESAVLFECSPHVSVVFSGSQISCMNKGMMTIFKWPKHLIVLNFVNSGITINKMAKVFITLIS